MSMESSFLRSVLLKVWKAGMWPPISMGSDSPSPLHTYMRGSAHLLLLFK